MYWKCRFLWHLVRMAAMNIGPLKQRNWKAVGILGDLNFPYCIMAKITHEQQQIYLVVYQ
jgi:hypothetical protein